MGYRVLGNTQDVFRGHGPRKGLEGPFVYANGRVLYYDAREGRYWDPATDFYVEQQEMDILHQDTLRCMSS
jgi:hypothetical protein